MRDPEYRVAKKANLKTDPKSVVLEEYLNFLDVFLNNDFDILLFHQKYNYKIILKEYLRYDHAPLYKISF